MKALILDIIMAAGIAASVILGCFQSSHSSVRKYNIMFSDCIFPQTVTAIPINP